jgi:hypothetical protein
LGGTVSWPVARLRSVDELGDTPSELARAQATYTYSRHGCDEPNDLFTLTGQIRSIEALHYDLHAGDGPNVPGIVLLPTAGTERLTTVESDQMWELEPEDATRQAFAGWVVKVDVDTLRRVEIDEAGQEHRPKVLDRALAWYRSLRASKHHEN